MLAYLQHLLRRGLRLFYALAKVMLPIMLLVQIGQWLAGSTPWAISSAPSWAG